MTVPADDLPPPNYFEPLAVRGDFVRQISTPRITLDIDKILTFLYARIREGLETAQAATPGPWTYNSGKAWFPDPAMANRLHAGGRVMDEPKLFLYAKISADEYARARLGEEFVKAADATCIATTGPADDPQSMADAAFIASEDPAAAVDRYTALLSLVDALASFVRDPHGFPIFVEAGAGLLVQLANAWKTHADFEPAWDRSKRQSDGPGG